MAHLGRRKRGERDRVEGQIMLGHKTVTTSDTYAPFDTGYSGRALEGTRLSKRSSAYVLALSPFHMPRKPEHLRMAPEQHRSKDFS